MRRCEVWWSDLPPPAGRHPVVLLSRAEAYAVRAQVTVAPVTTRIRGIPVEVELGPADGLPKRCVVNLDSIVTIPKSDLVECIGLLRPEKILEVEAALRFALGLSDP
ncbi:MAG TPA: type II toxin-antitoxin system PemK/MazF family toxin [Thermoanaerobaculia bacterium]|nr:type II toxin-antitoxin system PemK/MazF family toxin [Thermoanaerobaculia bacterium]